MKRKILLATLTAGTLAFSGAALAGDAAAGKAKHEESCAECHEIEDFEGMSAAEIEQSIKDILAGKTKHKEKLDPSIAGVAADLAAFYASGG